jgi:hypothetical protein
MFGIKTIAALLVFSLAGIHPIHVSVTEIAYDEKEKELEIILRAFADDIELGIRQQRNQPELNVLAAADLKTMLWNYVQPHFTIQLDGKPHPIKYIGYEKEDEVFIFYIQVQPAKPWKTIDIKNSVLTEVYTDQSNLINVTHQTKTKSLRLMRDNPSGKLTFDGK